MLQTKKSILISAIALTAGLFSPLFWGGDITAQSTPFIKIDGVSTASDPSSLKLPYWLKAGQTIEIFTNVSSISVLEFTINGTELDFSQVISVTTIQTVPAGKTWKVESVSIPNSQNGANSGWTDDGTVVRLTTSTDNVGIGTTAPGAKVEVAGQIKITGGTPAAGEVLTSDASGLATWEPGSGSGQFKVLNGQRDMSTASGAQIIPHGGSVTPKYVIAFAGDNNENATYLSPFSLGASELNGTNKCIGKSAHINRIDGGSSTEAIYLGFVNQLSGRNYKGVITADATNVTISWTREGAPTGTISFILFVFF